VLDVTTRLATPADEPHLWQMLVFAASMEGKPGDLERAKSEADLRRYVEGFGRKGDLGVVAVGREGVFGAAWLRLCSGDALSSQVWTHDVPELAIGIVPAGRGRGVGSLLLRTLIEASTGQYPALLLSVREESPAVRLYERFEFVEERRIANRAGGVSLVMRRPLP
jgi:ribosomal protein S18 acetylase RimI-like enzyme